jgi:hypothetical protein
MRHHFKSQHQVNPFITKQSHPHLFYEPPPPRRPESRGVVRCGEGRVFDEGRVLRKGGCLRKGGYLRKGGCVRKGGRFEEGRGGI